MNSPVIFDAQRKIWSNPFKVLPRKKCLGQIIMKKLNQSDPNKIIEVNYDNGEKLTSGQLKRLVITAAQNLLDLGIKKGDIVLFFSGFQSLTTPIVFACYIIGVAVCPIDLTFTDDDTDYVTQLINPTIILYDPVYKKRVESTIERINLSNLKYVLSFESCVIGESVTEMLFKFVKTIDSFDAPDLGDPDVVPGALILTSGTTARPKVICLSHSHIIFGVDSFKRASNIVIYIPSPFRWIAPVIFILFPIFVESYRIFSGQIPTPELCLDLIRKYEVTYFFAVDGLITKVFQYAENHQRVDDLKTLRYVGTGGERITKTTNELVTNLTPAAVFFQGYGMTELAGVISSTASEFKPFDVVSRCGFLRHGVSVKIIDDNGKSLGPNENGQICIKRIIPHLKYYNNDKANSDSFPGNGEWYLTGDYGKFDNENYIHFFNRCKDVIKCGQYAIIPSILEKHLEEHASVEVSYVVGIPSSEKGEIPVAFIKLKPNALNDSKFKESLKDDIKIFLNSVLPADQLSPEKIYFLDKFPYTSCGKVDKIKLRQWLIDDLIN